MNTHELPSLLIVDDDPIILILLEEILKNKTKIDKCANAIDALHWIALCDYPLVIADINMPYVNGVEMIEFINNFRKDTKFILVSSVIDEYADVEIKNVVARFKKPFDVKDFCLTVYKHIEGTK
jgi:two-component system response regulator YesN